MKKNKKKRKIFLERMRKKLKFIYIMFGLFLLLPIGKIIKVNAYEGDKYAKKVLSQRNYNSVEVPYKRGDILDCNGTVLATSVKKYSLIIEPKNILKDETKKLVTINALKKYFGLTDEEIEKALTNKDSLYKRVKKNIDYATVKEFKDYQDTKEGDNVVGVWFEEAYNRLYPNGDLACHILGFTVSGNEGLGGLEGQYDEYLNGEEGRTYTYMTEDYNTQKVTEPATNGYNLVTTIDAKVQRIVQESCEEYMKEVGAKNVSVLVMNPKNCEILALYNSHQYDPNDAFDLDNIQYQYPELTQTEFDTMVASMTDADKTKALNALWRNFVISDTFEPGSTYKTFVISGAIEEGVVSKDDTFYCDGNQVFPRGGGRADWVINCHKRSGHGTLTVSQALEKSCNDSLMQIAAKEGASIFDKYQIVFGMGQRTGIDISGEQSDASLSTLVFHKESLTGTQLATSSFGQGVTATMMQIGTGYCSVINGGYYYQPHVVKQIVDEDGNVVKNYEKILVRKTISEDTSATMREMLYGVVQNGSGKKAAIEGYAIGGKTGTAEKLPRDKHNYILSFIGFAPYDNPEVLIYCVVDEPHVGDQSSSGAGCVLFKKVAEKLFPYLNIYKTGDEEIDLSDIEEEEPTPVFEEAPEEGEIKTPEEVNGAEGTEPEVTNENQGDTPAGEEREAEGNENGGEEAGEGEEEAQTPEGDENGD